MGVKADALEELLAVRGMDTHWHDLRLNAR
jgi:hypothetical protein